MGTEILRPQDCLFERIRNHPAEFYRRKSHYGNSNNEYYYSSNTRSNRKQVVRSERPDQRKRVSNHSEPSISKRSSSNEMKMVNSTLMEKVTILRRGESRDSKIKSEKLSEGDGLVFSGTDRFEPNLEMVPNQERIVELKLPVAAKTHMYAGSAFFVSPAPSSLPLPSFSKKKHVPTIVDDSATRDLRRLLRIDA